MMMKTKMMMLFTKRKLIVQEWGNQAEIVYLWRYYNHSWITTNHICN